MLFIWLYGVAYIIYSFNLQHDVKVPQLVHNLHLIYTISFYDDATMRILVNNNNNKLKIGCLVERIIFSINL